MARPRWPSAPTPQRWAAHSPRPCADRIVEATELAAGRGWPILGVWHCSGARLADGVESMDGCGRMFRAMSAASGKVPQISIVVGPAAGAAAYGPALTDFVLMSTRPGCSSRGRRWSAQ